MRKKFEYLILPEQWFEQGNNSYGYKTLQDAGADGWELVSVCTTYETGTTYYFKRLKLQSLIE